MPPKKPPPTFPLHILGDIGQTQILKSLSVGDLISFSAACPKARSQVKRAKIATAHVFIYTHLIHFSFQHDITGRLEWKFVQSNMAPANPTMNEMVASATKEEGFWKSTCQDIDKAVAAVLAYIRSLFRVEITCFSFELTERGRTVRDKLAVLGVTHSRNMDVYMSKLFEPEDLKQLVDSVTVDERLHVKSATDNYFEYNWPFVGYQFDIRDAKWFTRTHLVATNVTRLTVSRCTLRCEDANQFLVMWQRGEFQNLQTFEWVSSSLVLDEPENRRVLFAGLQPRRFDVQHSRDYILELFYFYAGLRICTHCVDIKQGCDVIRETDGAVATIATYHCEMLFIVWGDWIPESLKRQRR